MLTTQYTSDEIPDDPDAQQKLFIKLCDLVNDGDQKVRVAACRKLGRFKSIPKTLLLQTLSKKELNEKVKVREM
jgi:hypothetical protein